MIHADLKNRRALVTGGASGIGLACVTMLAQSGAKVALNYLEDDPAGPAKVAELQAQGLDVIGAPGNVSIPGNAEAMVKYAIADLGGLDFLVNNAGTAGTQDKIPPGELDRMTEEFWQLLLNTNLIGAFRCAHASAEALQAQGGAIVNIASIAGIGKQGSSIAYAASKAAVINLTRALSTDHAADGIRVNAISAGAMRTLSLAGIRGGKSLMGTGRDWSMLKEDTKIEGVAGCALYLLSPIGQSITGEVLHVDAGFHAVGVPDMPEE